MKKSTEENGEIPIHLDGKLQNLISRKSGSPFQKQPFADVLQCRCSEKWRNIRRKTPALESLFNKVPVLQACNFIKMKLQQRCFPANIAKFLRTAFFIEHFRYLLLPFMTTFRNYYWRGRWITVNKDYVYSTPEKHLKILLRMLQVVNKETQSLLLTFSIFHVLF